MDVFEDCSILAKKQWLRPRKLNSLMNFASLDAQLDPPSCETYRVKWILGQKTLCEMAVASITWPKAVHSLRKISRIFNLIHTPLLWNYHCITIKSCTINHIFHQMLIYLSVSITIWNSNVYDQKYGVLFSKTVPFMAKCLYQQKQKKKNKNR